MKVRIHNNDDTDQIDVEGESLEEIREEVEELIKRPSWCNGWSETIEE